MRGDAESVEGPIPFKRALFSTAVVECAVETILPIKKWYSGSAPRSTFYSNHESEFPRSLLPNRTLTAAQDPGNPKFPAVKKVCEAFNSEPRPINYCPKKSSAEEFGKRTPLLRKLEDAVEQGVEVVAEFLGSRADLG